MIDADTAWDAVKRRDRSFDGRFVTGVLTTGIYCRPSCAARHPRRDNVRFFADGAQARAAGLRACKRCLPDDVARDEAAVRATLEGERTKDMFKHLERRWHICIDLSVRQFLDLFLYHVDSLLPTQST